MPREREDWGGRVIPADHIIEEARSRGEDAGRDMAKAEWEETLRGDRERVLDILGDRPGDMEIDELVNLMTEPAWLSGEWAGESISELLGDLIQEAEDNGYEDLEGDILDAYEDGARDGFWDQAQESIEAFVQGND